MQVFFCLGVIGMERDDEFFLKKPDLEDALDNKEGDMGGPIPAAPQSLCQQEFDTA